jgi:hypothetical protein
MASGGKPSLKDGHAGVLSQTISSRYHRRERMSGTGVEYVRLSMAVWVELKTAMRKRLNESYVRSLRVRLSSGGCGAPSRTGVRVNRA